MKKRIRATNEELGRESLKLLSFSVEEKYYNLIEEIALKNNTSRSKAVRDIIQEYLTEYERKQSLLNAEEQLSI